MNKAWQTGLLLSGFALAAAGGFWGARMSDASPATTEPAAEEPAAIQVETAVVRAGRIDETATAYGVIQNRPAASKTLSVGFESSTTAVHASVGDVVSAGEALVDLDASPDAKMQRRLAEEASAAADRAAEQTRHRRDQQLATNADVAAAEQAQQTARTQLDAQRAKGDIEPRTLNAEVAGIVTALATQPGQINAAGAPLVVIAPNGAVEAHINIQLSDAATLPVGAAVHLLVPSEPSDVASGIDGTVQRIGGTINPQTHLGDLYVTVPAGRLPPGAFVEANYVRRAADGLIVPRSATTFMDDAWTVYVIHDGKATKHVVALGLTTDDAVQITGDGIAGGDVVVTSRNGELEDGSPVDVSEPPSAATVPATAPATSPAGGSRGAQ